MREATVANETALEYCRALLNAETEEELIAVKEEIARDLKVNGMPEESIQAYLQNLDMFVEKLNSEEYFINEDGQIVANETPTQEVVETNAPQSTHMATQANTLAGISLGVAGAAIVACLALKKKVLKKKKNKTL